MKEYVSYQAVIESNAKAFFSVPEGEEEQFKADPLEYLTNIVPTDVQDSYLDEGYELEEIK